MHVGVFILLLLSGERNFGVRLNKLYLTRVPMDLPIFTGNHADLLILVRTAYTIFLLPKSSGYKIVYTVVRHKYSVVAHSLFLSN